MSFILDASVAAKLFNLEELSEKAVRVKEAYVKGDLHLAALVQIIYEIGNSIWRNPLLTDKDATEAVVSFLRLGLDLLQPTRERVIRSMEIAGLRKATFYDASYLQAAEELKTTLLTADQIQLRACKGIAEVVHLRELEV